MAEKKWSHNNIEISFDSDEAMFYAQVPDGEHKTSLSGSSLQEIKKKIDRALKTSIKKGVKLFLKSGYGDWAKYNEFEITSISADGRGFWGKTDSGRRKADKFNDLFKYSPEDIKRLLELKGQVSKAEKEIEGLEESLKLTESDLFSMLGLSDGQEKV